MTTPTSETIAASLSEAQRPIADFVADQLGALNVLAISCPRAFEGAEMTEELKLVEVTQAVSDPERMTPETVPEWLRELSPEEYSRRRNEEIDQALYSVKTHDGSWIRLAASCLFTAGHLAPEFGSYSHSCIIMAEQLMKVHASLASTPAIDREQVARAIAPDAFRNGDIGGLRANGREIARLAADRIIALLSGEG